MIFVSGIVGVNFGVIGNLGKVASFGRKFIWPLALTW